MTMLFHLAITFLMLAALAAFLILWYLWIKRKLSGSFFPTDEQRLLFPFRSFSWILLGVVLLTCVVHIHFLRVSSVAHEKLAGLTFMYKSQAGLSSEIQDLKKIVSALREDRGTQSKPMMTRGPEQTTATEAAQPLLGMPMGKTGAPSEQARSSLAHDERVTIVNGFAQEAKASGNREARSQAAKPSRSAPEGMDNRLSMTLDLNGRVITDALRVRKRPASDAVVIDKLGSGEQVKVTEKRVVDRKLWYRVITPSGRAGWVDFRYLELLASSRL
jgi:hypothetical protein